MMGSRLRENVKQLFECFCEVAAPSGEKQPWILQKYPESFTDPEILKSVPKFAYPCEFENSLVQHFSFVLTSIDSKWTFGFCRHDPKTETALVVLSPLPWHETFYKLLNHIATLTSSTNAGDLWKFLGDVYSCSIPMPGASITIPLPDPNVTFVCQSPRQFQLPSIPENRNLTEYYSAVDSQNMMIVFASMLYERRIIFTSKRLSRLSACVQACNALIYPMIWQHIYIPVLPLPLMDYLLAPMPFLIGVPAPILLRVRKSDLGEVVILDADSNTIETPFQDLESLPPDVVTNLKRALRNRPALLGDGVSRAFLRALVQLTAGYREALTLQQGERITFDENAFVENRPTSMQPFLRKMLELQIFQQFIEERLHMLNSGLGFSDEFEMEACNYSDKSSSKFMQQYREWTYAMRKEGSAFFRSVKDKANPAVKYAVKSVKDKGKDMKTAYKGLKWKGRSRGNENSIRFQQPRSAPSSPTLDRRPSVFGSPSKSPSGFTATTSYRKELRLRNINVSDARKQYSPLSPNSPEDSDSPPERLNIDLMHELQDVIFPNNPPVDRTLKPVRSLDSLRPAWSGRLRHGPPPCTVTASECEVSQAPKIVSPFVEPYHNGTREQCVPKIAKSKLLATKNVSTVSKPLPIDSSISFNNSDEPKFISTSISHSESIIASKRSCRDQQVYRDRVMINPTNPFIGNMLDSGKTGIQLKSESSKFNFQASLPNDSIQTNNPFAHSNFTPSFTNPGQINNTENMKNLIMQVDDPFDTSQVKIPSHSLNTILKSANPKQPRDTCSVVQLNTELRSAQDKTSTPVQQDLIRLDSTNSDDDFDPLLWSKPSKYGNSKQMTQSLHIPQMGEGLSNPLYPYFLPQRNNTDVRFGNSASETLRDFDLLQEYGLDFNKFSLANGASSSKHDTSCDQNTQKGSGSIDDAFGSSFNSSTIKSQQNWTKFE